MVEVEIKMDSTKWFSADPPDNWIKIDDEHMEIVKIIDETTMIVRRFPRHE